MELENFRAEAWRLLTRLGMAPPAEALAILETIRPSEADYGLAFLDGAADRARLGYRSLWAAPVVPGPKAGQTSLRVSAARVSDLLLNTGAAQGLPGGYARIAPQLVLDRVWVAWKYTEPGETLGMAWDGLVWLDDHWAWFPKPWRVLAPVEAL